SERTCRGQGPAVDPEGAWLPRWLRADRMLLGGNGLRKPSEGVAMLPSVFEPFLREGPFCVLARAALESLYSRERLDGLFELKARHPSWLAGYRVRILDGNALSATERRLVELRDAWDAPLPGRVLAVLDPRTGLVGDVFVTPDGHEAERSLIGEVLGVVRRRD